MHAFSYMIHVVSACVCLCHCVCVCSVDDRESRIENRVLRIENRLTRIKDRVSIPNFVHFGFLYGKPKWTKFGIGMRSLILEDR